LPGTSGFFQFGVGQYQPFFPSIGEVHKDAAVFAAAFEREHAAFAEFGVAHGRARGKGAPATWYGRLVFAYAIWQFVALMLEYSAPAFVFESSRLLNVTNIPSYPSIVSFLLLTLIALGLLRRQRPALWMSVILWQGLSLVLSAVAGILPVVLFGLG